MCVSGVPELPFTGTDVVRPFPGIWPDCQGVARNCISAGSRNRVKSKSYWADRSSSQKAGIIRSSCVLRTSASWPQPFSASC